MHFNTIDRGVEVRITEDLSAEVSNRPYHVIGYANGARYMVGSFRHRLTAEFAAEDLENLLAYAYVRGESDATRRVACG